MNIEEYAGKLSRAETFEAWSKESLVGLVAVYANDTGGQGYISSVSVLPEWTGQNIATTLLKKVLNFSLGASFHSVRLKVTKAKIILQFLCIVSLVFNARWRVFISMCLLNNRG